MKILAGLQIVAIVVMVVGLAAPVMVFVTATDVDDLTPVEEIDPLPFLVIGSISVLLGAVSLAIRTAELCKHRKKSRGKA